MLMYRTRQVSIQRSSYLPLFLFRPGSLIVEFKVGVQDSQAKLMIAEAKRLLKTFSKFDQNYFAVKDPQGLLC